MITIHQNDKAGASFCTIPTLYQNLPFSVESVVVFLWQRRFGNGNKEGRLPVDISGLMAGFQPQSKSGESDYEKGDVSLYTLLPL